MPSCDGMCSSFTGPWAPSVAPNFQMRTDNEPDISEVEAESWYPIGTPFLFLVWGGGGGVLGSLIK